MQINRTQRLYVLPCGNGFTCLGFDYAERRRLAVLQWIGKPAEPMRKGSKRHYDAYHNAMMEGLAHATNTGQRCPAELTPALVGLEGERVEVVTPSGNKSRFIVGRSTGWLPQRFIAAHSTPWTAQKQSARFMRQWLQLNALGARVDTGDGATYDNAPAIAALGACLADAGHIGFEKVGAK